MIFSWASLKCRVFARYKQSSYTHGVSVPSSNKTRFIYSFGSLRFVYNLNDAMLCNVMMQCNAMQCKYKNLYIALKNAIFAPLIRFKQQDTRCKTIEFSEFPLKLAAVFASWTEGERAIVVHAEGPASLEISGRSYRYACVEKTFG